MIYTKRERERQKQRDRERKREKKNIIKYDSKKKPGGKNDWKFDGE